MNAVKPDGTPKYSAGQQAAVKQLIDIYAAKGAKASNAPVDNEKLESVVDMIGQYKASSTSALARTPPQFRQAVWQRLQDKYPDWSEQTYNQENRANVAFGTGPQGNVVRSLSVATDHLDTLKQIAHALGNSDKPAYNRLRQEYLKQTGSPLPTNFDAAKGIVGDEVVKAVVGSGGAGALADREEIKATLNRAMATGQIDGAIDVYIQLMGGQLKGLRSQYERATGKKDFNTLLTERARKALGTDGQPDAAGGAAAPKAGGNDGWTVEKE